MSEKLKEIFSEYAQFGTGQTTSITLDNSKFFKLIKEAQLIEGKLGRPDVDIAFQKIMKKERKMTFPQFLECLELLAKKKGMSPDEIKSAIVEAGGPKTTNVTKFSEESWVQKQTDAELYTGIHKYRFDQEGKGRGLEGRRASEDLTDPLSHILDRSAADIRGRKVEDVAQQEREEELKARVQRDLEEREKKIKNKE